MTNPTLTDELRRTANLNGKHQTTIRLIFQHPLSRTLEWPDVVHLLNALGTVEQQHSGLLTARIAEQVEVLHRPKHKDVGAAEILQLRRCFQRSGIEASA